MREGRSLAEGWRRVLLPSFLATALPFLLLWLPGAESALLAPWERFPSWAKALPAFAYLGVFILLRASGGPSGVAPMVLLPVFWLGLYGTRLQLFCLLAGLTLVLFGPLIIVGGPGYPPSAWRAGVLFVVISGVIGVTIQAVVALIRRQEQERTRLLEKLDDLAHSDALTGVANRRAWETELQRGLARARRTGDPVSVALVDIDSFKAINDDRGHPGGDALLIGVAQSWADMLRPDDVLARIGGDEFAVLMPACTEAEAEDVIARLRSHMPAPYTCSVGLATWDRSELADRLMIRADDALYEAKRNGQDESMADRVAQSL
jgi:diguanylate cyclase (GGDEF)-like protein